MNRQKAKVAVPALAVAALAAAGIWYWSGSRNAEVPGTIAGNGTVEATEVDLAARVSGRLVVVGPREGDVVRKGQEVAVLDAPELGAQVEQARGNLAAAEAALADLAAGSRAEEVRRLRAQAEGAADALAQAQARLELLRAGTRVEDVRGAEAAAGFAASQLKAAQAALDLAVAGPRRETIQGAEARAAAARGALAAAEALAAQTRIVAPTDGRVTLRNAEPGEVVTPGFPILRVAELGRVWLRVYVPEPRIGLLRTGQRAEVSADAFPGRRFPGVVTEIAEKPEFTPKNVQTREERAKLVFGVKVEVENPGGELKPGMPADAVISVR